MQPRTIVVTTDDGRRASSRSRQRAAHHRITVTTLDCTPQVRHDNFCDRHFEDDLWQYGERPVSSRRLTNRRQSSRSSEAKAFCPSLVTST